MNALPDKAIFEAVAELRGILPAFVEKDWFVTQVIAAIGKVSVPGFQIVFTGGTALSKAHGLLERFSEDVDFRVVTVGEPKRAALSAFKKDVVDAIRADGFIVDDSKVRARDSNRFFSIDLDYASHFSQADALRPHIQVEVSIRATQLLPIDRPVASFVSLATKSDPEVSRIACIDPVESAADKLSALAWRILDRVRGGPYDDPSVVRHIHDLAILKDRALASDNFAALVLSSMHADATRPKNRPEIADLSSRERLAAMVETLTSDKIYVTEYERFVGGVSYANAGSAPTFPEACKRIKQLLVKCLYTN